MSQHEISHLLVVLFALLVTTKVLGLVAQRLGQPSVAGELIAGILLGRSLLGLLDPGDPVIHGLADLGVIVLLFEIGLHTDIRSLPSGSRRERSPTWASFEQPKARSHSARRSSTMSSVW